MKINKLIIILLLLFTTRGMAVTETVQSLCKHRSDINFSDIISCYRERLATAPVSYYIQSTESLSSVELRKYQMRSQSWSPNNIVHPDKWQHNVDIYIPQYPVSQNALLVINNGINYHDDINNIKEASDFTQQSLARIARTTNTIVISVSNVPNQYLKYGDESRGLKEDDSVARSWMLFMDHPERNALMPLHIPMAVTVSQVIRMAKQELKPWKINKFIITGLSKRGWSAWLTAISDPDVVAIVPFVLDLLNTRKGLEHIYLSYGKNWPLVFYPYYQHGIDKRVNTSNFIKLMKIEDPFQYMNTDYSTRLSIPKYIINASGDDFYVPDNTRFYYSKLPGEKSLSVVPNTDHYGIKNITEQSLIPFVNRFQSKKSLPELTEHFHDKVLRVNFSEPAVKIIRWTAINSSARDFRYACGIRYTPSEIQAGADGSVSIALNNKIAGWEATFLQATFKDGYVATSQVYITPDKEYPDKMPPSDSAACQTLPGRGLGENSQ